MKIRCVVPNTSPVLRDGLLAERRQAAGPGVFVDVVNIRDGPISLETVYEEMLAGPGILELVALAEEGGFDAVMIDCFLDPAIRAAREMAIIPVVGPGECGMLFAMALGEQFTILTVQNAVEAVAARVRACSFGSRVASIRAVDFTAFDLIRNDEAASEAMTRIASRALESEGADVILLGCTGMSGLADTLHQRLGAIVLDPAACALKTARAQDELGLQGSRTAYPDLYAERRVSVKNIIGNADPTVMRREVADLRSAAGAPGATVDTEGLNEGPRRLECVYEERLAAPYILQAISDAATGGYDAVTLDCFGDPAMRAARELVDIPVIGAGLAGMLFAMLHGDYFSVITIQKGIGWMGDNIRRYGFQERLVSLRAVDIDLAKLVANDPAVQEALYQEAARGEEG